MLKTLVMNGWAAGIEAWDLCRFSHDWIFSYIEQMDGLPERIIEESDSVLLVGFSMGGENALRLSMRYRDRIRGLVLVSATARMLEDREHGWKGLSERRLQALGLGTQILFGNDTSEIYDAANMKRGLDFLAYTDLRESLLQEYSTGASFPVAIFQSDKDGVVRPQNAEFLHKVFPHANVTIVPGTEHVLPISIPGMIDEAVMAIQDSCARIMV